MEAVILGGAGGASSNGLQNAPKYTHLNPKATGFGAWFEG